MKTAYMMKFGMIPVVGLLLGNHSSIAQNIDDPIAPTEIVQRIHARVGLAKDRLAADARSVIGRQPQRKNFRLKDYAEVSIAYEKRVAAAIQATHVELSAITPKLGELNDHIQRVKGIPFTTQDQIQAAYSQVEKLRKETEYELLRHYQRAVRTLMVAVMDGYPYRADFQKYPENKSCFYLADGKPLGCKLSDVWKPVDRTTAFDPIHAANAVRDRVQWFHELYKAPMLSNCRSQMCVALHFADVKATVANALEQFQWLSIDLDLPEEAQKIVKPALTLYGAMPLVKHLQLSFDSRILPSNLPFEDPKQ
jgi:hypothetical protein